MSLYLLCLAIGAIGLVAMALTGLGRHGHGHVGARLRSEEHTSELQSQSNLVCRLLLEKKKNDSEDDHLHLRRHQRRFICFSQPRVLTQPKVLRTGSSDYRPPLDLDDYSLQVDLYRYSA